MNRISVLIALLGLALFAACNQSDGSGSEWICDSYVDPGSEESRKWTCDSQQAWDYCHFKYLCTDADETSWFCDSDYNEDEPEKSRLYSIDCDGSYICQDEGGHRWACDTASDRNNCEATYFTSPESLYYCNVAFNVYVDQPEYYECPDVEPYPTATFGFACPRLEPTPTCFSHYQERLENECYQCRDGLNNGTLCWRDGEPDNSICIPTDPPQTPPRAACWIANNCRTDLRRCRTRWTQKLNNPDYEKYVPDGCSFLGNGECVPLWSLSSGEPKNYCNLQTGCSPR